MDDPIGRTSENRSDWKIATKYIMERFLESMDENKRTKWAFRLDGFCAVTGGLLPLGLVIGNTGFEAIIALVGLLWIIRSFVAKENPFVKLVKHPIVIPWLVWLASVFISLLWNGPGGKGWGHDVALIRYFLYVAAIFDISERRDVVKYLLFGMVAGIVWGALNTLQAYVIGYDVFGRPLSRYSYKLKDASRIASLAAYAGPFLVAWGTMGRSLPKFKRFGVITIGAVAMFQVFHVHIRTVEIAAIAGIFAFLLYISKKQLGWYMTILLIGVAGVSAGLFIQFGPRVNLGSVYDRIGYWKVVWAMWRENPIVGVSVSAFQDVYKEMAASDKVLPFISPDGRSWKALEATHAHNLFFHLISCTGILGLLSFSWLFLNCVREVIKRLDSYGHALLTWPVVFLVIGLTGWNIFGSQYQTLLAYFVALTGAAMANNFQDQK